MTLDHTQSIFPYILFLIKYKEPISGLSRVPINSALSNKMFDSSQQVYGNKEQLFQSIQFTSS